MDEAPYAWSFLVVFFPQHPLRRAGVDILVHVLGMSNRAVQLLLQSFEFLHLLVLQVAALRDGVLQRLLRRGDLRLPLLLLLRLGLVLVRQKHSESLVPVLCFVHEVGVLPPGFILPRLVRVPIRGGLVDRILQVCDLLPEFLIIFQFLGSNRVFTRLHQIFHRLLQSPFHLADDDP